MRRDRNMSSHVIIIILITIQITHHISDESIKRPSSDFKSSSVAEDPKQAGTTNTEHA